MDFHAFASSGLDDKLKCFQCTNYLSYFPISICSNSQSLCGRCVPPEGIISYRNKTLESVYKFLKFPCRYKSRGCSQELKPEDVPPHEQDCPFRLVDCITKCIIPCPWFGALLALTAHCKKEHALLFLPNAEFVIDLTKSEESKFLVEDENKTLIFSWKFQSKKKILSCALFYEHYQPMFSTYQLRIKSGSTTMLHDLTPSSSENKTFTELCLTSFLIQTHSKSVLCRICINGDDGAVRLTAERESTFLKFLKCGTCSDYAMPPIFRRGKTLAVVCSNCSESLRDGEYYSMPSRYRDYCLDEVARLLSFPCSNSTKGCTFNGEFDKMKHHQLICAYQTKTCPFKTHECAWQGLQQDLKEHILSNHQDLELKLEDELRLSPKNTTEEYRIIKFGNSLFRLTYVVDSTQLYKWAVQHITPDENDFKFEIEVIDARKKGQRVTIRRSCGPIVEGKGVFLNSEKYCYLQKDQICSLSQIEEEELVVSFKVNMSL